MPGLLDLLDSQFDASGLATAIEAQSSLLSGITHTVSQLGSGPDLLGDLEHAIGSLPLPPELSSLSQLPHLLDAVRGGLPHGDLAGPLAPILQPLEQLAGDALHFGSLAEIVAAVQLVRSVVELVSTQVFSGAAPFPFFGPRGMPGASASPISVAAIQTSISAAEAKLSAFGSRLDATRMLELLKLTGDGWLDLNKWPSLPVITEVVETMETVVQWERKNPSELTTELVGTLRQAAELIATPRTRIAAPLLSAALAAGRADATLDAAASALDPLLAGLRGKIADTLAQPSAAELVRLEAEVAALETLVAALDWDATPLARADELPPALELQILRVVRALEPPAPSDFIASAVQTLTSRLPSNTTDPLQGLVDEVTAIDLSVLTDPLRALKEKVDSVAQAIHDAEATVSSELTGLLSPVADALDQAKNAIDLDQIRSALSSLPQLISDFVDQQIKPKLQPLRDAIHSAVDAVSHAADDFHPEQLVDSLKQAISQVHATLQSDEIKNAFQEVQAALHSAADAIEQLSLHDAADEAIARIGEVEQKVRQIDPNDIPDAAKPLLKQAVQVVTNIDFTHEVAEPVLKDVEKALEKGPALVLDSLQELMDQLKGKIEQFKPSVAIGSALDKPFDELLETLHQFAPSHLLQRVSDALAQLVSSVHLIDPDVILHPLEDGYHFIVSEADKLRPSALLKPVNDAISSAIGRVIDATHIDTVFDGVDQVLGEVNSFLQAFSATGTLFGKFADLLENPGDMDQAIDALVDQTLTRLDGVEMSRISAAFSETAAAVHSIERDALARDIADALGRAASVAPVALASNSARRLKESARAFPLVELRGSRSTPARRRLVAAIERLLRVADALERATAPWQRHAAELAALAPQIQPQLATYARVLTLDQGSLFGDFITAPADAAALREKVRVALVEGLRLPVSLAFTVYRALAPHMASLARGMSDLVAAFRAKLDAVIGPGGVGGVVTSIEQVTDVLRHIDLSPITGPLDAVYARVTSALTVLDPAPLRAAIEAAMQALTSLLQLGTLVDPSDISALDGAYNTAVSRIEQLSPSALLSATLDPLFEEALGDIKPFLDLPSELQSLVHEAGVHLKDEITSELARVEVAFDAMLRAIPLDGASSAPQLSGSVAFSASAGG